MRKIVVGVMGPGDATTEKQISRALQLGRLIAREGWIVLSGGRNTGVMDAVSRGAKEAHGLTVGILPDDDAGAASEAVDIAIVTGMGSGRNNINVLSSDVVVACGMGAGTASEVALALKAGRPVVILSDHREARAFFGALGKGTVSFADSPEEAVEAIKRVLRD
jgi:uncharacterized protein (TIGR00725 family)